MTVWRFVARLSVVLLFPAGAAFMFAGPAAAAQGVTVQITELPGEFTAGAAPARVTVVASKRGGNCIKVRWSMVLQVDGASLDQMQVDRIEDSGSFPVDKRTTGNAARFTDQQLDPGTLCRDRTVTARYTIGFTGDVTDARVTLQTEAYDSNLRLLEQDEASRDVTGGAAQPSPSDQASTPPAGAAPRASDVASADPAATGTGNQTGQGAAAGTGDPVSAARRSSVVRVGPVGLAVGAVMVFLGFGLLLRVRRRLRLRPAGRPGQGAVWYGSGARRRTHDDAWRGRTAMTANNPPRSPGYGPPPGYGREPFPAPVTAPVGAGSSGAIPPRPPYLGEQPPGKPGRRKQSRRRQTLTLPPLRR